MIFFESNFRKIFYYIFLTINFIISPILFYKLLLIPKNEFGLFQSGIVNLVTNYSLLLSFICLGIIFSQIYKTKIYILLLVFLFSFVTTLLFFDAILEVVFILNLDAVFGFDKFSLIITYFLSIILGIFIWLNPVRHLYLCFILVLLFSFIFALNVGLKDIEVFGFKSFVNFPGGNIFMVYWILTSVSCILRLLKIKNVTVFLKIFSSWLVAIGCLSIFFSIFVY